MKESCPALYWFTPLCKPEEICLTIRKLNTGMPMLFCMDKRWNTGNMETECLKREMADIGSRLIFLEGDSVRTVPSVARVMKVKKVVCIYPEPDYPELESLIRIVNFDLQLHSIELIRMSACRIMKSFEADPERSLINRKNANRTEKTGH